MLVVGTGRKCVTFSGKCVYFDFRKNIVDVISIAREVTVTHLPNVSRGRIFDEVTEKRLVTSLLSTRTVLMLSSGSSIPLRARISRWSVKDIVP